MPHFNNQANPISHPIVAYPEMGPQVIVAEDDGMEVDASAVVAPEEEEEDEEEIEPFEDDQGDGISDVESDPDT